MQTNVLKSVFVAVALVVAVPACSAIEGRQTAGQYVDDASISTKVRAAFVADDNLKARQISVETFNRTVQLSGFVDSSAEKSRATDVARKVEGVQSVKNDLVVR
ncbi:MAG: BON domain-containing protein [Alphaproteobacteria bacterium]